MSACESIWVIVRPSGEMGVTYPSFEAADAYRVHLGWNASTVRRYDLAREDTESSDDFDIPPQPLRVIRRGRVVWDAQP